MLVPGATPASLFTHLPLCEYLVLHLLHYLLISMLVPGATPASLFTHLTMLVPDATPASLFTDLHLC